MTALRAMYAAPFLDFFPARLGSVMRRRLAAVFARHSNRANPYYGALFVGELADQATAARGRRHSARAFRRRRLSRGNPARSFEGFTLSNVLDGAPARIERRLFAAVKHAAARCDRRAAQLS